MRRIFALLLIIEVVAYLTLIAVAHGAASWSAGDPGHHRHHRCWTGIVPVRVAKIGGPWHTIWVRETICGNTVTLP